MAAETIDTPIGRERITAPRIPPAVGSMAHLHDALTTPFERSTLKSLMDAADAAQETLDRHDAEVLKPLQEAKADPAELSRQLQINNDLFELCARAEEDVAAAPVTTATELHVKLTRMVEWNLGNGRNWLPELLADAARIAAGEAN
jgi:hypothetical protein